MARIYITKEIEENKYCVIKTIRTTRGFIEHFFEDSWHYMQYYPNAKVKDLIKSIESSLKQTPKSDMKFKQEPIDIANNKILPILNQLDKDMPVHIDEDGDARF